MQGLKLMIGKRFRLLVNEHAHTGVSFSSFAPESERGWGLRDIVVDWNAGGVPGSGSAFPIGAAAHYTYALPRRDMTTPNLNMPTHP